MEGCEAKEQEEMLRAEFFYTLFSLLSLELKLKKIVFLLLIPLLTINLVYANVICDEDDVESVVPSQLEVESYMLRFFATYNTLVTIQKDVDKSSFGFYGEPYDMNALISSKGEVAYVLYGASSENISRLNFYSTDSDLEYELFDGPYTISGVPIEKMIYDNKCKHRIIFGENYKQGGRTYPHLIILSGKDVTLDFAESSALHVFLKEYRELIVKKAKKIAEENQSYESAFKMLSEQNKLMKGREKLGVYSEDRELFLSDSEIFFTLANKSGFSKEISKEFKELSVIKKEIFGHEYENNWVYSTILSVIILIAILLGAIIHEIILKFKGQYPQATSTTRVISEFLIMPIGIAYLFSIRPYDYSIISFESLEILSAFALGIFILMKFEESKQK